MAAQAKREAERPIKNFILENRQAQLAHTSKYLEEKHRFNRLVEERRLQLARKRKQALESAALRKRACCLNRWSDYRI